MNCQASQKLAIQALGCFEFFDEHQLVIACKEGIIRQYEINETIYHDGLKDSQSVYFVLSGECMILQILEIEVTKRGKKTLYKLSSISEEFECDNGSNVNDTEKQITAASSTSVDESNGNITLEKHLIDVGTLYYRSVFGVGENFQNRLIIARTTVQCLLLPRCWLFERQQNPGNFWQKQRFHIETLIPTREILLDTFVKIRKWQKFRKKIIQAELRNSNRNIATIDDVPIICRILENQYKFSK